MKAEKKTKKAPDKSPENDLSKALEHLRSARAKFVKAGDEKRADEVKDVIGQVEAAMQPIEQQPAGE